MTQNAGYNYLYGNPNEYVLTKANVDDREVLFELAVLTEIDKLISDKGYVRKIAEELKSEIT